MQKRYTHVILLLLAAFIASCNKDFLDRLPEQATETRNAIKDLPGLRAAISGVYSLMQSENYYGRTMPLVGDLLADNEYISVINANRYRNIDQYIVTANDVYTTDAWNQMYGVVANANMIIQKGPYISMLPVQADSTEAMQIVAEAYAIRALAFFDLARLFAQPYNRTPDASHMGIPLITVINIDSVQSPARSTIKQTYNQIISDLNTALKKFDESNSTTFTSGRFNSYAVTALLARVLLYKEDWAGAAAAADAVIASNRYSLLPTDKLLSNFGMTNNGETVLEIVNTVVDNRNTDALSYMFNQSGYGDVLATDNAFDCYNVKDERLGFLRKGRRTGSGGENPANVILKYKDVTTFSESIKVIRLAEIFLIRAEALAHLGRNEEAQYALNAVIRRSEPGAAPVTVTGDALLEAVALERRRELAFEGHRIFDLTRTKKSFIKYLAGDRNIPVDLPSPKIILPIPQRELDANPNIRHQQNEGYN
ncbi:MAG TPA: RagB/SusD family nutrient uptake outer membrane protein [Chitinophaga sp.]|uniref:RagB/SusD family nutrient uptake outer membrane protein n=1 Tax=Chitinophaga sp. TaxID=1869181 RepID=UPI002C516FA0|nr:RagB/SusD family nutrient uptake outer membrane protein [Chitinophaga sp.]HVI43351.1 RagB/SusD family nutrient uptake outer membrane protein [Chitinophaga sp.]